MTIIIRVTLPTREHQEQVHITWEQPAQTEYQPFEVLLLIAQTEIG